MMMAGIIVVMERYVQTVMKSASFRRRERFLKKDEASPLLTDFFKEQNNDNRHQLASCRRPFDNVCPKRRAGNQFMEHTTRPKIPTCRVTKASNPFTVL